MTSLILIQAKPRFHFLYYQSKPVKSISHPLRQSSSYPLSSSSSSEDIQQPTKTLTKQELIKINVLLPRLCLSNNLTTAIHLTTTALLANPPPKSVSLSILIDSLTSQPDLSKPMSLLTILRHNSQTHSHLSCITTMLVISYAKKKRPKEAFKVYQWMLRPGSPCEVEKVVFLALVNGFCESGLVLQGLRVLRDMVDVGFEVGGGVRRRVYRSLLMEARVREAVELDKALTCYANGDVDVRKVRELLDSVIGYWTE